MLQPGLSDNCDRSIWYLNIFVIVCTYVYTNLNNIEYLIVSNVNPEGNNFYTDHTSLPNFGNDDDCVIWSFLISSVTNR